MNSKKTFWDFPGSSKIDELQDNYSDDYLIFPALRDELTQVEHSGRCEYILFSDKGEALLYRPKRLIPRLAMELYVGMLSVIRR